MPNLWKTRLTAAERSWLEVRLPHSVEMDTVILCFDTDLNRQHAYLPPLWKSPCCPASYRLLARCGGSFREVYARTGNYQRRNVARFDPVVTDVLRLEILGGNPADPGGAGLPSGCEPEMGVYEIRAYRRIREPMVPKETPRRKPGRFLLHRGANQKRYPRCKIDTPGGEAAHPKRFCL